MSPAQRSVVLGGALAPPSLDISFMGGVGTLDSRITFARTTVATDAVYTDATGSSFNSYLAAAPRMTTLGLLMEAQRKQSLLNSEAPVTQTTASLATGSYALWVIGTGTATPSAGTATATGFAAASAGSPNIFTVTVAGTVVVTVAGSLTRFQLEAGGFPTSYMQTTGVTFTRALETATMPIDTWYNSNGGTLVVYARQIAAESANSVPVSLDGAAVSTRFIVGNANTIQATDTTSTLSLSIGAAPYSQTWKGAFAFKNGTQRACLNGGAIVSNTLATISSGITTLSIGSANGIQQFNGWIQRVIYYPYFMSNAGLKAVSA